MKRILLVDNEESNENERNEQIESATLNDQNELISNGDETQLIIAAKTGDIEEVKRLLGGLFL